MNDYWLYLVILAVVIVAALAFYAGSLLRQVANQTKANQQAEDDRQKALAAHDGKVLNSVLLIVKAMQAEQCDFGEGCWRLSVLLDSLKTSEGLADEYPAIFKLYNEIKHLSILEERKKLPKKQRMKEDFQRLKLEAQLHEEIVKDLDLLQQYTTQRIAILIP